MRNLALSIPIGVALLLALATARADPPARVGRLSLIAGEVTVHDTRTGDAEAATLNWPITGGMAIVTARGGRAEVRIGSTAVRVDGATDLEFERLDDDAILLRLREGTVNVRVRDRETAAQLALETPHSQTRLLDAGGYRFDANPRAGTSTVTTFQGNAQVALGATAVSVASGRRAEIGDEGRVEIVGAFADGFDDWALARDRSDELAPSTRYVSSEMTGYESLDGHGDWRTTPEYGVVWVPRAVPVGWAPYRHGRWVWIEPWGWTWIDDAPWGFAPFHYGRWALIGGVWAWAPGIYVARPVYAPALVGWIGQPGWSITVSIGAVSAVGWFPLAPREAFVPAYRCSTVYVRNVNVTHVTNVSHSSRPRFAHRHVDRAVTVVPASALTHGRPVAPAHVRARPADLAAAVSHKPPETVARPPRRSPDGGRPRQEANGPRRSQESVRSAPNQAAPAGSARPPARGERTADRAPARAAPVARPSPDVIQPAPRTLERAVGRPPAAVERRPAREERNPQPEPQQGRPAPRAVERAAPIQPVPGPVVSPPGRALERSTGQRPPAAVERRPAREERNPQPERQQGRPAPRAVERAAPIGQPAPNVAVSPRLHTPERAAEQRPPVAARRDSSPRIERAPVDAQRRAAEPPRRLERRPEPARIERQVERARVPAPAPRAVARPPGPELRREARQAAPAATIRAAPPQLSLPRPPAERSGRGERRGAKRR